MGKERKVRKKFDPYFKNGEGMLVELGNRSVQQVAQELDSSRSDGPKSPSGSDRSVPSPIDRGDNVAVLCVAYERPIFGRFHLPLFPAAELCELVGRDPLCVQCLAFGCAQLAQPFDSAHQCNIGPEPGAKGTRSLRMHFSQTRVRLVGHTHRGEQTKSCQTELQLPFRGSPD